MQIVYEVVLNLECCLMLPVLYYDGVEYGQSVPCTNIAATLLMRTVYGVMKGEEK